MSIPRIIHYCDFGYGSDKETLNRMLNSVKKHCPDYEVILWNEENFDININRFTKEAAINKKWAFVSDVCRLYALKTMGGIYLDTDVEIIRPLDSLLEYEAVFGFESKDRICTAIIGSEKDNTFISELLSYYDDIDFDMTPNVEMVTRKLVDNGLKFNNTKQIVNGITILPQEYLSPKDYETSLVNVTDKTLAIHYYVSSWKTPEENMRDTLFFKYLGFMPRKLAWNLANYRAVMKHRGIIQGHKDMMKVLRKKA